MNIIFLEAVQNFGGARKSTVELAEKLQKSGHEVLVIDFWGSCKPFTEAVVKSSIKLKVLDRRPSPILLSDRNRILELYNGAAFFIKWLNYRRKVDKIIKTFDANLIIVNNSKTLSILNKSSKYKIGYFARGWHVLRGKNLLDSFILKKIPDIYIAVSQATRQAMFSEGIANMNKIFVVPNSIDDVSIREHIDLSGVNNWASEQIDRPIVLLHCGGFLASKGQHITIEIAKILKSKGVDFRIDIAGIVYKGYASNAYYNSIIEQIREYNLNDEINLIIDNNNVYELFVKSDILIHPTSTEGLPRVVMESMALGKPVIGNAVGGMTDYILHGFTGFLTNLNNVDDYVNYILMLKNDKELYSRISECAKSLIGSAYRANNQLHYFSNMIKSL